MSRIQKIEVDGKKYQYIRIMVDEGLMGTLLDFDGYVAFSKYEDGLRKILSSHVRLALLKKEFLPNGAINVVRISKVSETKKLEPMLNALKDGIIDRDYAINYIFSVFDSSNAYHFKSIYLGISIGVLGMVILKLLHLI